MRHGLWFLSAGIFLSAFFPALPGVGLLLSVAAAALAILPLRRMSPVALFVLGVVYGCLWGHGQLRHSLPPVLDKSDIMVTGVVAGIPDSDDRRSRFELDVESLSALDDRALPALKTLRLSWYGGDTVRAGERWQFVARVRSPRGFTNPGGFDYGTWLFSRGVSATGYVREGENRRLAAAPGLSLHGFRQSLFDRIAQLDLSPAARGLLAALVLGETHTIPRDVFDSLIATGTVHLMVVSGLHIGLVTGLCFLAGTGLGRVMSALGSRYPARFAGAAVAIPGACLYALLAGFGLPVKRALIMSVAALLALVLRRRVRPVSLFAWALAGVALVDPLAVTRQGFWLSFIAVAALMAWFIPRPNVRSWRRLVEAQGVIFVALAPLLIFFQGRASLVALPLNLVVIPWISLAVVPLGLLGAVAVQAPFVGEALWTIAGIQLDVFSRVVGAAADVPATWSFPAVFRSGDLWLVAAGSLAALLIFLPRGVGGAVPCAAVLAGVLLSGPPPAPFLRVAVLDVGQGLAVVVEAEGRTLVYDTGARFSDAFDTGSAVVAPYLRSLGRHRVDRLVVSHGDNDHAGGVAGLVESIPVAGALASQPKEVPGLELQPCERGRTWRWQRVGFRFLWPDNVPFARRDDNNHSCVLLIEAGGIRVLLPGDIEKETEKKLLARTPSLGPVDLLVAPHHGSKSSSSSAFVRVLAPAHVVYSAGFNHHFGHPHKDVVARYAAAGSKQWWTARSGAVIFSWQSPGSLPSIVEARSVGRRYWDRESSPGS